MFPASDPFRPRDFTRPIASPASDPFPLCRFVRIYPDAVCFSSLYIATPMYSSAHGASTNSNYVHHNLMPIPVVKLVQRSCLA